MNATVTRHRPAGMAESDEHRLVEKPIAEPPDATAERQWVTGTYAAEAGWG